MPETPTCARGGSTTGMAVQNQQHKTLQQLRTFTDSLDQPTQGTTVLTAGHDVGHEFSAAAAQAERTTAATSSQAHCCRVAATCCSYTATTSHFALI